MKRKINLAWKDSEGFIYKLGKGNRTFLCRYNECFSEGIEYTKLYKSLECLKNESKLERILFEKSKERHDN